MDYGQQETERILKNIEKRINHEYAVAMREIEDELSSYFARFEKKDETWRRWVATGERTKEEYQKWRIGQMAVGRRWADQKESIAKQLVETSKTSLGFVRKYSPEIYAENFNYSTYQVEHMAGINTPFTLYSKVSVNNLVEKNPDIAPPVGKKLAAEIAEGKAIKWNKQQIQSVMIQGILQGDSIPKLANRLATKVSDKDRKASIRNARTLATGVQNVGRVDSYKRAQDMGVDLEQMWMATLDGRTRHSHRWLDGEVRPVGEQFSNGLEYPADPHGDASEVYNCRCSLRGVVKGLQPKARQYRDTSGTSGMSYDEWRNAKATSGKITAQDEAAKNARKEYIDKYSGKENLANSKRTGSTRYGEYRGISFEEDNLRAHMGDGSMLDPVRMVMDDTGFDSVRAEQAINDITSWVGSACGKIRSGEGEYSKVADRIEEFIEASPKYKGSIYRGISLDAKDANAMLDRLLEGETIDQKGISSWATDKSWAEEFATMQARNDKTQVKVVFQIDDNKSGVSIKHIADIDNDEVIQPAKAMQLLDGDIKRVKNEEYDYYLIRVKENE